MKTLPPETRAHIEAWIEKTHQGYNTDDSEPVKELLEAYDAQQVEIEWLKRERQEVREALGAHGSDRMTAPAARGVMIKLAETERERAWIYNITASSNVSEDMKETVDDILDAERERHYAREDRLEAAKKLLREAVAIVETPAWLNEAKLDEWITIAKEFLEDTSLTTTKKIIEDK